MKGAVQPPDIGGAGWAVSVAASFILTSVAKVASLSKQGLADLFNPLFV